MLVGVPAALAVALQDLGIRGVGRRDGLTPDVHGLGLDDHRLPAFDTRMPRRQTPDPAARRRRRPATDTARAVSRVIAKTIPAAGYLERWIELAGPGTIEQSHTCSIGWILDTFNEKFHSHHLTTETMSRAATCSMATTMPSWRPCILLADVGFPVVIPRCSSHWPMPGADRGRVHVTGSNPACGR